ncbi:phosphoglycolate phosphatase [Sphaerochaeta associata]|uniref:phosphoglycolate phosphatase n=1 Tax=Sphaerochaeta associata TaxID=1129264 RepID=A0ABY4DC68_9SPIR|nr:HAD family hydrolase [Sphaerochaeta associata]UOM51815.1 HAD family hydrolase [Sphaerochaeta associata]SMP60827.1 phosphoglycolate phosphatase [Sphaerochaeta associata]
MKQYKALIFDFDMTLADSAKVIAELLNVSANDFGYPSMSFKDVLPVIGNTHEVMLSHVTGENNPQNILNMRTHYRQLCRTRMAQKTEIFPDVPACLENIAGKGIKIGLLSLKLRDVLMQSLVKYNLAKYFSAVVGCEDVAAPKPDPSGLFTVLKVLDVGPQDALYIGDSLVDEGAAKAAGVDFSAMLRGGTTKEQFDHTFVKHFYSSAKELSNDIDTMAMAL